MFFHPNLNLSKNHRISKEFWQNFRGELVEACKQFSLLHQLSSCSSTWIGFTLCIDYHKNCTRLSHDPCNIFSGFLWWGIEAI